MDNNDTRGILHQMIKEVRQLNEKFVLNHKLLLKNAKNVGSLKRERERNLAYDLYSKGIECCADEIASLNKTINYLVGCINMKTGNKKTNESLPNNDFVGSKRSLMMHLIDQEAKCLPLWNPQQYILPLCGSIPPPFYYIATIGDPVAAFVKGLIPLNKNKKLDLSSSLKIKRDDMSFSQTKLFTINVSSKFKANPIIELKISNNIHQIVSSKTSPKKKLTEADSFLTNNTLINDEDSNVWILAKVLQFYPASNNTSDHNGSLMKKTPQKCENGNFHDQSSSIAPGAYEIMDIDEGQECYLVDSSNIIPLPKFQATHPNALYKHGTLVLARYPQTTCFYPALIQEKEKSAQKCLSRSNNKTEKMIDLDAKNLNLSNPLKKVVIKQKKSHPYGKEKEKGQKQALINQSYSADDNNPLLKVNVNPYEFYMVIFEDPLYPDGYSPPLEIPQKYVIPFRVGIIKQN